MFKNAKFRVISVIILTTVLFCSASEVFSQDKGLKAKAERANIYLEQDMSSTATDTGEKRTALILFQPEKTRKIRHDVFSLSERSSANASGVSQAPSVEMIPVLKPTISGRVEPQREREMKLKPVEERRRYIKVGVNYFRPSKQIFRDIYGNGVMYRAEICIGIGRGLELWMAGGYFSKNGKLSFTDEGTKLQILPVGWGIKYISTKGNINYYTGIGFNYYQVKETNPIGDVGKGRLGFGGEIGAFKRVTGGLIIDFRMDYYYCKMELANRKIDIGGLTIGIGLGYEF
ncbi:hypothetical protein LCGC14_1260620 [marine sediment metagenome]|uniref:Outer membrane protein beta-barrel domain-containing protein n=1 Tax=marine sediment metagenome TaxID=412755 RepID=A0A0F9NHG8_9ZZZZ